MEGLLWAGPHAKRLTCTNSSNPHDSPLRRELLTYPLAHTHTISPTQTRTSHTRTLALNACPLKEASLLSPQCSGLQSPLPKVSPLASRILSVVISFS